MNKMKEYEPEFDQLLFYLPLSGSAFKKVYYDELLDRAVSKFVPADDLVVPYTATSLEDAESIVHVLKISENDLRKQQVGGFYSDIDLPKPAITVNDEVSKKEKRDIIPAVTHIDGTGRLQSVDKEISPKFYELIYQFYKNTNVPVLLNTSFNENEPIDYKFIRKQKIRLCII